MQKLLLDSPTKSKTSSERANKTSDLRTIQTIEASINYFVNNLQSWILEIVKYSVKSS